MFDHNRHRIFWCLIRRKADEKRVVPAIPWQILIAHDAAGTFCHGDVTHLTGAGFARNLVLINH